MKTTTSQTTTVSTLATLRVFRPDGTTERLDLIPDKLLVIGNSSGCGLKLNGPGVAGTHCMLSLLDGQIHVRDWNSELGTFVNGKKVDHEAVVAVGAEIRVGGFRLVTAKAGGTAETASESQAPDVDEQPAYTLASDSNSGGTSADGKASPGQGPAGSRKNLTDTWPMEFSLVDQSDEEWVIDSGEVVEASAYRYDDFQVDAVDLLQAEVDLLRTELADRDARLAELEILGDLGGSVSSAHESVSSTEIEALALRLEQLLAELEQSDERISTLTELLRTAEEVNETMVEEHRQMDGWVAEIERRVGQREEEWRAERTSMQKCIDELTKERDQAEQQVSTKLQGGAKGPEEYLRKIRLENTSLKARLQRMEQEHAQLEQRLDAAQAQSIETQVETAVEEALREERLQLTQEKAALARERADVARLREEVDREQSQKGRDNNSADHRIRAFREHLREIHDNEPSRRKNETMADRLAKLWRKLDGRPLDTD